MVNAEIRERFFLFGFNCVGVFPPLYANSINGKLTLREIGEKLYLSEILSENVLIHIIKSACCCSHLAIDEKY